MVPMINSLKANPEKFQFMVCRKRQQEQLELEVNSTSINESDSIVLLGITIDNQLNLKMF